MAKAGKPNMRLLFIVLIGTLLSPSIASAGELTATELFQYCSDRAGSSGGLICSAYVEGFTEGLIMGKSLSEAGLTFCPPRDLTVLQARLIVEKWMREHPKALNDSAKRVSIGALIRAYPCQPKNSN
jgi:hypothetical protein